MFRTDPLSIRSLNTVYTATRASSVGCLLADANKTNMTNTYCCVYSVETPDGQWIGRKHVEFFIKINLRNSAPRWLLL